MVVGRTLSRWMTRSALCFGKTTLEAVPEVYWNWESCSQLDRLGCWWGHLSGRRCWLRRRVTVWMKEKGRHRRYMGGNIDRTWQLIGGWKLGYRRRSRVRGGRGKQSLGHAELEGPIGLTELGEGHRQRSVETISELSLTFHNLPNPWPSPPATIISNIRWFEFEISVFILFIYIFFRFQLKFYFVQERCPKLLVPNKWPSEAHLMFACSAWILSCVV